MVNPSVATTGEDAGGFKFTRKRSKKAKRSKRKADTTAVPTQSHIAIDTNKRQRANNSIAETSTSSSSSSSSTSTKTTTTTTTQDSLVPKYPTVKPQPSIRNVTQEDPAAALTELTQNLVECETKAVKRQFVGMNSFISEWASACCEEFLAAVENKMDQKRQQHLIVAPQQLVNPENVRLTQQRDQLEQLLQRLGSEVKAWQSHSNEEWNRPMNEMSTTTEEEDAQEAAAYHQNIENDTSQPFERMNSTIMKMVVQVEQIQHALEQSKRTVTIAETKRMQLSAQVHSAGKYSKKPASSLIRGFLG